MAEKHPSMERSSPTLNYFFDCHVFVVVVVISPQASRRRIMLAAYDLSMTNGSYVYFTVDALPQTGVVNIWKGDDGRNWDARRAFEAVFHVSI